MKVRLSWLAACLFAAAPASADVAPPTPLFAGDETIRLTIKGPIAAIAREAQQTRAPRDGLLTIGAETLPVRLSPRGITRLKPDVCRFPPLRVEFVQPPPDTSLFARQKRLKLVTHCRQPAAFQKHLLLEYAAYRLYNAITPASHRVRLAAIDYVGEDGRPIVSRLGFFLEDIRHVGERNGLKDLHIPGGFPASHLSPRDAARAALLHYMIGNLDWSLRNGPAGDDCCHNGNLIGAAGDGAVVPVPYDFDFSGLVNAPYAVPPDVVPVQSVRQRHFRGYCRHSAEALSEAAAIRSRRDELLGIIARIPGLDQSAGRSATAYLQRFFEDIATDESVRSKLLKTCL